MKIAAFLILMLANSVCAAPMFRATAEDVQITLHDEKCSLPSVSNLHMRAVWLEKGKAVEGCWGVSPFGFVMFYFADRTVAVVPQQQFHKVQGA